MISTTKWVMLHGKRKKKLVHYLTLETDVTLCSLAMEGDSTYGDEPWEPANGNNSHTDEKVNCKDCLKHVTYVKNLKP
jgi:hypothetical protein